MRAGWSSRAGLVWAAAGSAVGFGNLLKFPAALERGGGAFLLLYLLIVCLMGMPLLCLEFWAGRRAGGGPPAVMGRLAVFPLLACVFSLAYYLRLGGWTVSLLARCAGLTLPSPAGALLFGVLTLAARRRGAPAIERCSRAAMPLLILLLTVLALWAASLPGAGEALGAALRVEPSALPEQLLPALGQAFFSLSLGMGVMLTYGSYLPPGRSVSGEAAAVCLIDTLCALLAAAVVLPLGMDHAGDAAFFLGMERLLAPMPMGGLLAAVGLAAILLAALTSSMGMADCIADAMPRAFVPLMPLMLLLASPTAMQASPAADWLPRTIDLVLLPASEAALLVLLLVKTLGIFTRKYYKIGKNGEKPKKPWLKRGKRQRPRFGIFD